jgi:uncharacterized protein (DUF433 family)
MQPIAIIDRGRGPEIAGTRITVFDILPYVEMGWHHSSIALLFSLSSEEVLTAIQYFRDHETEMTEMNRRITERIAQGNPPDVEVKKHGSHTKLLALRDHLRHKRLQEVNGSGGDSLP